MAKQFEITLTNSTKAAAVVFISELDKQIDELQEQLSLAQTARSAVARTFGIDRRDNVGAVSRLLDSANRQEYEGKSDGEAA